MVVNGFISVDEAEAAKAKPLNVSPRGSRTTYIEASGYFSEEVRRRIIDKYGNETLYAGGLAVRTTLDTKLQLESQKALRNGLAKFDKSKGYRGPAAKIETGGDWGIELSKVKKLSDVPEWDLAVVLASDGNRADIGIQPKKTISGKLVSERTLGTVALKGSKWALRRKDLGRVVKNLSQVLAVGDVIYVEKKGEGNTYVLQQVPKVGGGIVAMDPNTGRVLAMSGGFSFSASQFNRATQAKRQPGSSFKPFVYAAALDNGYTPSTVVLDAPIKINQGGTLGFWEPKNYGGKKAYAGPTTLRRGIEKSKNLMTVRLAKDMGMDTVAEYAERFGIYDNMLPVLANSLGAEETTVLRMVSAYAVLANGGRSINPSFIDRIQDRYGKTIFKHDQRICESCNAEAWEGQPEPEVIDNRDQVLDPMTAYQITSMMEGVVQRGTAQKVKSLGRPIAGKTGTTNEEKDAWFVGYSPTLVVGVYVGFDTPKPMGKAASGGGLAAPIFIDFMDDALKNKPVAEFRIPEGLQLIPINAKNGLRANGEGKGVILEAFKPGSGPPTRATIIGFDPSEAVRQVEGSDRAEEAIKSNEGGLF
jgi:penicillin-binding protein 1A